MKTIIAGSRYIVNPLRHVSLAIIQVYNEGWRISEVVSGTAIGIDRAGEQWAAQIGIPIKRFPADWNLHGRSAGVLRNAEMAEYADALIAIWDGESRGTKNMIDNAKRRGLKVFVYRVIG